MQTRRPRWNWFTLALLALLPPAFAQGPLTPPGPPGETMKSLDQVEPRTLIARAPFTIDKPGSYYLAASLEDTVTIEADDVTLDLMGFAIVSTYEAVDFPRSQSNIVVRNGTLKGSTALDAREMVNAHCLFEDLRVEGASFGIYAGSGCVIRNCDIRGSSISGIRIARGTNSAVLDCRVLDNPGTGIDATGKGVQVAGNVVRGNKANYSFSQGHYLNLLLCEVPETISWPASIIFAGTLACTNPVVHGISIEADNVSIDLAGHSLIGPGVNSGNGISQAGQWRNLQVRNGSLVHWRGLDHGGIYANGPNNQFSALHATSNFYGLYSGPGTRMENCTASANTEDGLHALNGSSLSGCTAWSNDYGIVAGEASTLSDCAARQNLAYGITVEYGSSIQNCTASKNGQYGFRLLDHSTAVNCSAFENGLDGIYAGIGNLVSGCIASRNSTNGISVDARCWVSGNTCDANDSSGAGILARGSYNRIQDNHLTGNGTGLRLADTNNFAVRNSAFGNYVNFAYGAGNLVGTLQPAVAGAGPWDNFTR